MIRWSPVELGSEPPKGAYSRAIRVDRLLFVSGQVPRSFETGELLGESVAEQTRAVLSNLRRVLEAGGCRLSDVVSVSAFLSDIGTWGEFDAVYREAFRPPYPTRTTIGAGLHGVLVEINAVAVIPG